MLRGRDRLATLAVVLAATGALVVCAAARAPACRADPLAAPAAAPADASPPPVAARAEAPVIKDTARRILDEPRFAPRWSFWEWLAEKLGDWSWPEVNLRWAPGWGSVLLWALVIWCVLTLVAILAHFAWTVVTLLRGRRGGDGRAKGHLPRFAYLAARSAEELDALRARLAAEGAFREAIGVMMVALLKRLDAGRVVRFHESKTNGDYVREFTPGRGGRDPFCAFVRAFDGTIYRGAPCGRETYDRFSGLFEACVAHVR
jgi:hypothetical protein